jgi:hypothetical protein
MSKKFYTPAEAILYCEKNRDAVLVDTEGDTWSFGCSHNIKTHYYFDSKSQFISDWFPMTLKEEKPKTRTVVVCDWYEPEYDLFITQKEEPKAPGWKRIVGSERVIEVEE